MSIKLDDVLLKSAGEVSPDLLYEFYKQVYPMRFESRNLLWKWKNRIEYYNNKIPIVAEHKSHVIGHSGMIPVMISLGGEMIEAAWFVDFAILPSYQRCGIGSMLTQRWMELPVCCLTYCNEKSLALFKKKGWEHRLNSTMHINLIKPFEYPALKRICPSVVREIANAVISPFFYLFYKFNSYQSKSYKIEKLTSVFLSEIIDQLNVSSNLHRYSRPLRDEAYCKWRLLDSPNFHRYHIFKAHGFSSILGFHRDSLEYGNYIDVLWVSQTSDAGRLSKLICTLGVFGFQNNYSYIRFLSSNSNVSSRIKWKTASVIYHPNFAFYSKNESIFRKMKEVSWDLQLIDCDFEHLQ